MSYQLIENMQNKKNKLVIILLSVNIAVSFVTMSGIIYFTTFVGGDQFQSVFKNITKLVRKGCQEFSC